MRKETFKISYNLLSTFCVQRLNNLEDSNKNFIPLMATMAINVCNHTIFACFFFFLNLILKSNDLHLRDCLVVVTFNFDYVKKLIITPSMTFQPNFYFEENVRASH